MDWPLFWTIIGAAAAIIGFLYQVIRNFKSDVNKRFESFERKFDLLENRIFQLAMGKSLKEIMQEERK